MRVLASQLMGLTDGTRCRTRRLALFLFLVWLAAPAFRIGPGSVASLFAKEVSLEYQVKAVYLFNFARFVEWPPEAQSGPLTICVAGQNPFGAVLDETLRGESVNNRPLTARVIPGPEPGCHVIFGPQGAPTTAYLRAARAAPRRSRKRGRNRPSSPKTAAPRSRSATIASPARFCRRCRSGRASRWPACINPTERC